MKRVGWGEKRNTLLSETGVATRERQKGPPKQFVGRVSDRKNSGQGEKAI